MNKFKFDSWHGRSVIMFLAVLGLLAICKLPAYGNNKLLYLAQTPNLPSGVNVDNLPATPLPDVRQEPTVPPLPPAEDLLDFLPNQSPEGKVPEFEVQKFKLKGNTVLEKTAVDNILRKYSARPIGFADLLELETELTKLYTARGYINSGVIVPIQDVNQGRIILQAIEGKIETINVEVDGRLKPSYVRSRLARGAKEPLNIEQLQEALQLLQLNPLIENLNAELSVGGSRDRWNLNVVVNQGNAFDPVLFVNNNRTPSVGR